MIKEIKKQIDRQTREKVDNVRIDTESTVFRDQSIGELPLDGPVVIWDKSIFQKDRGGFYSLNPDNFTGSLYGVSNMQISTENGNVSDVAPYDYANVRYSGWPGIAGGGMMSFRIISANCSVSIWVDNVEQYSSGDERSFTATDINIAITDRSLVQIYWYALDQGSVFSISGEPGTGLTSWEQSDITPFFLPVLWYDIDPITTGSNVLGTIDHWVKLRWWFGDELRNTVGFGDLGGFGVWNIDFTEIGEIDVINADIFSVNGNYGNHKYYKVQSTGEILEPEIARYTIFFGQLRTWFRVPSHGLSDGMVLEMGIAKHLRDVPFESSHVNPDTIYETIDRNLEYGQTYYYLVDTYDSSPNSNRGGLTAVYKSIIAGDVTPPPRPYNVVGTRSSYDVVTIEWEQADIYDVERWHIWEDYSSTAVDVISGSYDYVVIDDYRWRHTGKPVTIEIDSVKYTRKVTGKRGMTISFDTPLPVEAGSGDTIRKLNLVQSVPSVVESNVVDPMPTLPFDPDFDPRS
ncbi:MAG: hypothetical protein ACW96U_00015 [Candidatus Heimdallarchaeaceae archaeon]|jgi:hypothetical protein